MITPLEVETSALALSFHGVRERGKNNGPEILPMLAHCSRHPGDPYCACFVSWTIYTAGMRVPVLPRFKRSASALRLADLNPDLVVSEPDAIELLGQGIPLVFTQDHGGGRGHCGFALGLVDPSTFESMEGNTGPGPSAPEKDRDGQGFFHRHDRQIDAVRNWIRIA